MEGSQAEVTARFEARLEAVRHMVKKRSARLRKKR
jgi:hypothetical protein